MYVMDVQPTAFIFPLTQNKQESDNAIEVRGSSHIVREKYCGTTLSHLRASVLTVGASNPLLVQTLSPSSLLKIYYTVMLSF